MFKLLFSTGTSRDYRCSIDRMVAFGHAIASDHRVFVINNPTELMATYSTPLAIQQWER